MFRTSAIAEELCTLTSRLIKFDQSINFLWTALDRFWFFVTNLSPKKQNRYNWFVLANLYKLTPSASPKKFNFVFINILFRAFSTLTVSLERSDRFHHLLYRESPIADDFSKKNCLQSFSLGWKIQLTEILPQKIVNFQHLLDWL